MGKKIDAFVLSAACASGLFFYFYQKTGNHTLCIILSLVCWLMLRRILRGALRILSGCKWMKRKNMRRSAGSLMMALACTSESEACTQICKLIHAAYDIECSIETVLLPPTTSLSQERLFSIWRMHAREDRLLICTTGHISEDCRILADGLKAPQLALLDGAQLAQLIADYPGSICIAAVEKRRKRLRLRGALHLLINRRNTPRCLICAFSMLIMYLMTGSVLYCASALGLLLLVLLSLRTAVRPTRLF